MNNTSPKSVSFVYVLIPTRQSIFHRFKINHTKETNEYSLLLKKLNHPFKIVNHNCLEQIGLKQPMVDYASGYVVVEDIAQFTKLAKRTGLRIFSNVISAEQSVLKDFKPDASPIVIHPGQVFKSRIVDVFHHFGFKKN